MKSNICRLAGDRPVDEVMLSEVKKAATYNELGERESLRLRLLAEELVGMLPNMSDDYEGEFWIENDGPDYELHASLRIQRYLLDTSEKFLSISKSGKNAEAKGIVGKIRFVIDRMFLPEDTAVFTDSGLVNFGMMDIDCNPGYSTCWSLSQYQNRVSEAYETVETKEAWDELEKSVIAKIADDVTVGIKGKKVEIIVRKSFR